MALSQIQCLDDNHVNPRTHEAKPEFLYCEDQRLALETLLKDGREAFSKYLEVRRLRGFLSDLEQGTLTAAVEPFDPESEVFPEDADDDQTPLSLQYWPELSDTTIPQMDLGWPDSDSYRGVTRTSVYTQPPLEGQTHIKEVVRKAIAQAQKVIAVVMDVFTDVDIFRDLLDAGFKRKVPVYILLERTRLPHFLSMCQRANMHTGHLKHLRVRCTGGAEFYTRHCTKVRGQMGHRFMFVDGDKAVSGSYSFTWMSARLDRNLIAVITGQAVDAFDQLFRLLYLSSTAVNLQKVVTEPEPEPDLRTQVASVAPPSAAVVRKMYNPKYALVALSNPSPTASVGNDGPKEPDVSENSKKKKRRKASEDLAKDAPPLHPGLTNLEKAYLIPYLPTWPEPDPPSDVIGFINIRDASRPTQVHLQRSEMFETSQAIKFSSPFKPQETLPEVTTPRQLTVQQEETNKQQLAQNKSETEGLVVDTKAPGQDKSKGKAPEQKSPPCSQKSASVKVETKVLETENKPLSKTAINTNVGPETPDLSTDTRPQSSYTEPCNEKKPSDKTQTASTTSDSPDIRPDTPPQSSNSSLLSSEKKPSDKAEPASANSPKSTMDHITLPPSPDALPQSIHTVTSPKEEKNLSKAETASATSFKPSIGQDSPDLRPGTPPHSSNTTPLFLKEKTLDKAETASTTILKPSVGHASPDLHLDTPPQSSNKAPSSCKEKPLEKAETASTTILKPSVAHDSPDLRPDTPLQSSNNPSLSSEEKPSDKAERVSTTSLKPNVDRDIPNLHSDTPPQSSNKASSSSKEKPLHKKETASTTSLALCVGRDSPDLCPSTPPQTKNNPPLSSDEKHLDKAETAFTTSFKTNVGHDIPDLSSDTPPHSSNTTPSFSKEKPSEKAKTTSTASFKPNIGHASPDLLLDTPPQSSNKAPSSCKEKPLDKNETASTTSLALCVGHDSPNPCPGPPPQAKNNPPLFSEEKHLDKGETASTTSLKPNIGHDIPDLHPGTPPHSSNTPPSFSKEKPSEKAKTASTTSFKPNVGRALPDLHSDIPPQSSNKMTSPNKEKPLDKAETASTTSLALCVGHDSPDLHPNTPLQSNNKPLSPSEEKPSDKAATASKASFKPDLAHDLPDLCPDIPPHSSNKAFSSTKEKLLDKTETASTSNLISYLGHGLPDHPADAPSQSRSKAPSPDEEKPLDKAETSPTASLKPNVGHGTSNLSLDTPPQSIHTAPSSNEKKPSDKAVAAPTISPTLYVGHDALDLHPDTPLQSSFKAPSFNENKAAFTTNLQSSVGHTTFNKSSKAPPQCSNKTPSLNQEKPSDKADICPNTTLQSSFRLLPPNEEKPFNDAETTSRASLMSKLGRDAPHLSPDTPSKSSNKAPSASEEKPSNEAETASTVSPHAHIGHDIANLSPHTPVQSSKKAPISNQEGPSVKAETASTTRLKSDSVTESIFDKEAATINTQSTVYEMHTVNLLLNPTHSNILDTQEKTVVSHSDSHIEAVNTQPTVPSEVTHNHQTPRGLGDISTSSASLARSEASTLISKNNPIAITTVHSSTSSPWTTYPSTTSQSPLPPSVSAFTSLPSLTSSASAFLTSFPPILNPHTVQLASNDSSDSNNQMVSEISSARRLETSAEMQMVHSVPALVNMVETCPVKNLDTAPGNSASEIGDGKDTKNPSNPINASQQKQLVSSQETKNKKDGHDHSRVESVIGTALQTQSDALIMDTPKTANVNIQEIIPKHDDSKTLILTATKTNSGRETTAQPENTLRNCELAKVTQSQTYLARSHEPQRISFSKFTSQDINVLEATDSSKANALSTSQDPYTPVDDVVDRIHTSAANALQPGQQAQFAHSTDGVLNALKYNAHATFQDQSHKTPNPPERPLHLNLSLAQATGLNSPNTKRKSPLFLGGVKTSTPDAFPSRSPTPDSRTTSPNPRSYTPDFRTPTSDISDGYISPREDSTFSNTSEEYYECSGSPMHDLVFEPGENQNQENYISLMYANISSAVTAESSPAYENFSPTTATLGTLAQNSSSSETSILFRTSGVSSSLLGTVRQNLEPEETNEVEDQIWVKRSNTERTDQESQWTEGTNSRKSNKRTYLQLEDDFVEMSAKVDEIGTPVQTRVLINSTADGVVDREVTAGEAARRSTGDPKPETFSSQMERPEKAYLGGEKLLNQGLLKSTSEDTRERQTTRDATVQKLLNSYSKPQRFQLQDTGSSRPLRSPRLLSGSQVPATRPLGSQTESKVYYSGFKVLNNTSSPPRLPSRPQLPAAVGPVGRKQVSHSLLSQQSPASQIRLKSDQMQSATPRPSYLQTLSNPQPQVSPPDLIQKVSEPGAPEQEDGRVPFSNFPFGRLYNFKGLRDKWTRQPAQCKRSSTDSTAKEHKSTN